MQLEQLIWGVTALGALGSGAAAVLLAFGRARVRETGIVVLLLITGVMFCAGGFLLSSPRYLATGLIAAGGGLVGILVGLAWGRSGGGRGTWQASRNRGGKQGGGQRGTQGRKNRGRNQGGNQGRNQGGNQGSKRPRSNA